VRRYAAVQGSSSDQRGEDYRGWALPQRLEPLAFDARLAGVTPALLRRSGRRLICYLTLRCRSPRSSGGVTGAMARLRLAMTLKHD
jgi:hypothetical protein